MAEPFDGDGGNRTHERSRLNAEAIPVPLRDRTGTVIAFAVLDAEDAYLADRRWYLDKGYARCQVRREGRLIPVYLHREVMGVGSGDARYVDHINGLPLDCRRANLRFTTIAENAQNLRRRCAPTSSRFRGVTWDKSRQKWMATAMLNGRRKTLGRFNDEEEAADVAAAWRAEHMPFSEEAA
jgi:hypothetical protein